MGRHEGAYDALLGEYLAGTLAQPVRVLLESLLELRAAGRSRGAGPQVTMRDPVLARLFGLGTADGVMAGDQAVRVEEARLPQALRDFLGGDLGGLVWRQAPEGGRLAADCVVAGCDLSLVALGPGERRIEPVRPVPEVGLVLEGAIRDDSGLWGVGDAALRAAGAAPVLLTGAGATGCVLLVIRDSARPGGGPLTRLFESVFSQIRAVGGVLRCPCCGPA